MTTLLIDNYDSFTFNLAQLIGGISGTPPVVIYNDQIPWSQLRTLAFGEIIISPGPGRPDRLGDFGVCTDVIKHASLPILGVCLGHQGIGYWYGAAVEHAPDPMHGRLSDIYHDGSPLFTNIPSPFAGVRYHSLLLPRQLPKNMRQTAWTADGLTMGIKVNGRALWGVQFHPESICTRYGRQLLSNFLALSQQSRRITTDIGAQITTQTSSSKQALPSIRQPLTECSAFPYCLRTRKLEVAFDTARVFTHLFGQSSSAFWLDSSQIIPGYSRFSLLGDTAGPHAELVTYCLTDDRLHIQRGTQQRTIRQSIFAYLKQELQRRRINAPELPFDFCGGWIGFLGYELKALCGGCHTYQNSGPDAGFIFADRLIVVDHQADTTWLLHLAPEGNDEGHAANAWFVTVTAQLRNLPAIVPPCLGNDTEPVHFFPQHRSDAYCQRITAAQHYIRDGESYEICLTNRFVSQAQPHPLILYRLLRKLNPAPYAAFLRLPAMTVLSSSPERFLTIDRTGRMEAKPIKGTLPRGRTLAEDARLAAALRSSEKNRAENLMIVDLLRNDLGRVCNLNTVSVPKLMAIESYATVHQMVSTITGRLRSDCSPLDAVIAAFPGGSMTGAPKRRTMELIDELEGIPRGVYAGALGFISLTGSVDLSIVIRTIVIDADGLSIGAGGAITHLSDPAQEYQEMLLKAQASLRAVALACTGNEFRFAVCDEMPASTAPFSQATLDDSKG
jgi:para-aminobenzoate synthetase